MYRPNIPLQHDRKIEKFNTFEVMEATLDDGVQLWRLVNIYRAPYSKKHRITILQFLDEFDQYLSLLRCKNGIPIILDDFKTDKTVVYINHCKIERPTFIMCSNMRYMLHKLELRQ